MGTDFQRARYFVGGCKHNEQEATVNAPQDTGISGTSLSFVYGVLPKEICTAEEAVKMRDVAQQTIIRCLDANRLVGFHVPELKSQRMPRDACAKLE